MDDREAKFASYAEAIAFFIDNPEAPLDPTLRLFVDFMKEKIAEAQARLGSQKLLTLDAKVVKWKT